MLNVVWVYSLTFLDKAYKITKTIKLKIGTLLDPIERNDKNIIVNKLSNHWHFYLLTYCYYY